MLLRFFLAWLVCGCVLLDGAAAQSGDADKKGAPPRYRLLFATDLTRSDGLAENRITVSQTGSILREVRLRAPADRYVGFRADGELRRDGELMIWLPPAGGGSLSYRTAIDQVRGSGAFDAIRLPDWAVFRGDDLFPPASIRQLKGAIAVSELSVRVPPDWSLLTPFGNASNGRYRIDNPERIFDRPVGWFVAGRIGVRKDLIAGIEVAVAGPVDMGIERLGMLALLRWNLPLLTAELDRVPARLSVISAADPMWRGGLSATNSLFIHSDRPLISENATSTLLHEVVHVLFPVDAAAQHDWIDEGLAEYLALEVMVRSGTISESRYQATLQRLALRGRSVDALKTTRSAGDRTARAVDIFHRADEEIRAATDDERNLYDVVRLLMENRRDIDIGVLQEAAMTVTGGQPVAAFAPDSGSD